MRRSQEWRIVANILRVDHAGEYGAIRIYAAQLRVARWRAPDLGEFLVETLGDERRHRDCFARLMHERGITPCRTLALWGIGGYVLGLMTSLLGRRAILVCTEAVERTVHRHMDEQIAWLEDHDSAVAAALEQIRIEELEHLHFAERERGSVKPTWLSTLDATVALTTEMLVWLSTYGASSRMARSLGAKASPSAPALS